MTRLARNRFRLRLLLHGLLLLAAAAVCGLRAARPARAAPPPIPIRTLTTVDSAGDLGRFSSLVLDADGFPVISYNDGDPSYLLKLAVCHDPTCANPTVSTVGSGGYVGWYPSLALDADGFPVISYYDYTNDDLKLAVCHEATCTNPTITTVDSGGYSGGYSSLALNADGFPVISYSWVEDLKLAVCHDPTCTNPTVTTVDSEGFAGFNPSLALDADGFPVISYFNDWPNYGLKLAVCHDPTCANPTVSTVDSSHFAGLYLSLALDADGFPVISYFEGFPNYDLKLAVCQDRACTVRAVSTVDDAGDVGRYASLALDGDGFPVISYLDDTDDDLKLAACHDATCTNPTITTVDGAGDVGRYTSLALDGGGFPVISYYDAGNGHLKLAVCQICAVSPRRETVDSGGGNDVGRYSSLALRDDDRPVIAHYDQTDGNLRLAVCDGPDCGGGQAGDLVTSSDVGKFSSLALNSNGFPVVSYYNDSTDALWVAVCGDADCSAAPTTNAVAGSLDNAGRFGALALRSDDHPVIGYYDDTASTLHLARCDDAACNPPTPATLVDDAADVGQYSDVALDASEHAMISYHDSTNNSLKLAVCNDAACSSPLIRAPDVDSAGAYTSIALNGNGYPVISYYDEVYEGGSAAVLKLAVCPNATCTTPTVSVVDDKGYAGAYTSLALNGDDFPIISYYDVLNRDLKIAFCTSIACTNPVLMTVDGAGGSRVGQHTSLALTAAGYPAVSYYDYTNRNLKVALFDYLPAPGAVNLRRTGPNAAALRWSGGGLYDVWQVTSPYAVDLPSDPCNGGGTRLADDVYAPLDLAGIDGSTYYLVVTARHDACDQSPRAGIFTFTLEGGG